MNTNKVLLAVALTMAGLAIAGTGVYAAQTPAASKPMVNLVNVIAKKFNLNASEVQKAFDEHRQTMGQRKQVDKMQLLEKKLNQAVKNGKISQTQKNLIIAKHAEMKTFVESLKDKTPSERQAAIKEQMKALKRWAADNKIPEQFILFGRGGMGSGMGKGLGFKMGFMMGKATK